MLLCIPEVPLSDEITHYEVLSYNSTDIVKQCEQYSQSTSSSLTKQFIYLSFTAMNRYSYDLHV